MNRNTQSHFAMNPTRIEMERSTFERPSSVKTSFNVGELIPFYVDEVLPGDTFRVKTSKVVRLQTMLTPMMDNLYLDTYYFFVPNRLAWEHWKQFMGENTESAWIPETTYEVPQITAPDDSGFAVGTIADYMGVPTGVSGLSVSALPFRAYSVIVNDWFRDQNLQDPLLIPLDDATVEGVNTGNYITDCAKGGKPFVACKFMDYFSGALPSPQKGPDTFIPSGLPDAIPVYARSQKVDSSKLTVPYAVSWIPSGSGYNNAQSFVFESNGAASSDQDVDSSAMVDGLFNPPVFNNLWAVPSSSGSQTTINQLRYAFQIQKLLERDARGGK